MAVGRLARAFLLAIVGLPVSARAQGQDAAPPSPSPPTAPEAPDGIRLTFGLGGSITEVSRDPRLALPLEVTLVPRMFWNTSAGLSLSSLGVEDAYLEVGFYLGVSVGAGIGYGKRETDRRVAWDPVGHGFVGVPLPLVAPETIWLARPQKRWFPYLLPYYRPSWDLRTDAVAHEVGLMIKMSYAIRPMKPWPITGL